MTELQKLARRRGRLKFHLKAALCQIQECHNFQNEMEWCHLNEAANHLRKILDQYPLLNARLGLNQIKKYIKIDETV